jgi:hypothetical protein
MIRVLVVLGIFLWTNSAWGDEYWRGWCAGTGHVRRERLILAHEETAKIYGKEIASLMKRQVPLTPEQQHDIAMQHTQLWYVHGQPFTFLWNGDGGPLWVTCPSGDTRPYDWEQPDHGYSGTKLQP